MCTHTHARLRGNNILHLFHAVSESVRKTINESENDTVTSQAPQHSRGKQRRKRCVLGWLQKTGGVVFHSIFQNYTTGNKILMHHRRADGHFPQSNSEDTRWNLICLLLFGRVWIGENGFSFCFWIGCTVAISLVTNGSQTIVISVV